MGFKLKWWLAVLPLCLTAAEPVFYMPMDGSADVIQAKGAKISAGVVHGCAGYQPGVIGRVLDVRRHAYDQVTAVTFTRMPVMDCNNGTVSFWFKPHWKETDPEIYSKAPKDSTQ